MFHVLYDFKFLLKFIVFMVGELEYTNMCPPSPIIEFATLMFASHNFSGSFHFAWFPPPRLIHTGGVRNSPVLKISEIESSFVNKANCD